MDFTDILSFQVGLCLFFYYYLHNIILSLYIILGELQEEQKSYLRNSIPSLFRDLDINRSDTLQRLHLDLCIGPQKIEDSQTRIFLGIVRTRNILS